MSDGFGGKLKDFFGFGEVENYQDSYYNDSFNETRDRRDERDARDVRDGRDSEPRGRLDSDDRYTSGTRSRYRDYDAGESKSAGSRYDDAPYSSRRGAAARPTREPSVVRLPLSSYTQASELVEIIKAGDVVVFNLGGMEKGEAKRALDFATGLSRGVDAELKKLRGVRNFVLIPDGLTLEQSQLDQLVEDL